MKKSRIILTICSLVAAVLAMSAQEKYLHFYKNGVYDKSYIASSVDSMTFDNGTIPSIWLHANNKATRVGSVDQYSKYKVGGALLPSGVYMGIVGFNENIYKKNVSNLSLTTKSSYTSFVSGLTKKAATLLYYGVEQALDELTSYDYPEDLVNVTMVTFTDGLDQGSFIMNGNYANEDEYLNALNNRIKSEKINGMPISAYSIGLKGNDVSDVEQFNKNLRNLASSEENASNLSNINEIERQFDVIADAIYNESHSANVQLTIPGQSNGTRIRFTFDNVSDAEQSKMYIEGVFRLSDRALTQVQYVGMTCESGEEEKGSQNGVKFTYIFEGIKTTVNVEVDKSKIKQYRYVTSTGKWDINSEFGKEDEPITEVKRKSAVVMLVLDCSTSLGSDFSTMQTYANNFINKLAQYGNDDGFTAIDLDNTRVIESLAQTDMVKVEGGTFTMGATSEQGSDYDSNERPVHSVTLSDFYIGKYEVTQALWEYVMSYSGQAADGTSMSAYASDVWLGSNPSSSYGVGANYPAYYVSHDDIVNIFIPRLNKITGKTYRLPTEAEWEYAARGGNKSKGYKYSGSNTIGDVAWYCDNSSKSHEVGAKAPNELGIYDMTGNVWEWCHDWYGSYSSSSQSNPKGPSSGYFRVDRGGSWFGNAQYCRVSDRGINGPGTRDGSIGFRLACSSL